jgi:hypothetical protein
MKKPKLFVLKRFKAFEALKWSWQKKSRYEQTMSNYEYYEQNCNIPWPAFESNFRPSFAPAIRSTLEKRADMSNNEHQSKCDQTWNSIKTYLN